MLDLLPGVPADHVVERLRAAGGKEIETGKFGSAESSAALAVNTFAWFVERPHLLPPIPGLEHVGPPTMVEVEYCARFPWPGGRHPWLDAVVETETHLIGIESKRFEPYRDTKSVSLSAAYDRPVWGDRVGPFERMRDDLRSGQRRFDYLDAAQLIKHAFGLVADAKRRQRLPVLVYLYAEPRMRAGRPQDPEIFNLHRAELACFSEAVGGAEVEFASTSYREWLERWSVSDPEVADHGRAVLEAFAP